jgi:glycosyltransferase involved in cell wall biosynthesis
VPLNTRSSIVALATAWGPRFGGINAFNTELVKSLGILPERGYDLICVVPGGSTPESLEDCHRYGVRLLSLGKERDEFDDNDAATIIGLLDVKNQTQTFWIGDDDKTGPLALELRHFAPGSRAALINHMALGAYQAVKKGMSLSTAERRKAQFDLFRRADICLAVGSLLQSHLRDLLSNLSNPPSIEMLVPGLADPTEYDVKIRDSPSENFVAFVAGRLNSEDDRIKQGRLALRGFGNAVLRADDNTAIRRSPTLRMRGVRNEDEVSLLNLLQEEAKGAVNFDFQEYTDSRTAYFQDLASASVVLMPSWHEGFGLTAWEAIACAIPIVVSEESGVFRLLQDDYVGAGLGQHQSVYHFRVRGQISPNRDEPNHTEDDVVRLADQLLHLSDRMEEAKRQALRLRRILLDRGLDWRGTALALVAALETRLGALLTRESLPIPSKTQLTSSENEFEPEGLRIPSRRPWRPELHLPVSMLLTARDEVVAFDPEREAFLRQLIDWSVSSSPLSVRLVFGPGGFGKTRVALETARRLRHEGWASHWLSSAPPEDWIQRWRTILRSRGRTPALLVIDYADARPAQVLAALTEALERVRDDENPAPIRLLFLARSESWLTSLVRHTSASQEVVAWLSAPPAIESVALPPWPREEATRRRSYKLALSDYAAAIGVPVPSYPHVPRLSHSLFDRPLYLHLAAVAALEGQRPVSADALLRDQLQREWRYWRLRYGEAVADYDDWADALTYIALCQGADVGRLSVDLESLGIRIPALAQALQLSYPRGDAMIAPLEPDLIAEELLRERLAESRGAALLDAVLGANTEHVVAARSVIARLAANPGPIDPERAPKWVRVLISALARNWPGNPQVWVDTAHLSEHGLGELLFAAWRQIPEALRASMVRVLKEPDFSINLLRLSTALNRKRLEGAPTGVARAEALHDLSIALSYFIDAESRAEAVACAREALQIRRELAHSERLADTRGLATALNNLAYVLAKRNDAASRAEALVCAREAVETRRQLADGQPADFNQLARSLHTLALLLSREENVSAHTEAIDCAREAVQIRRRLAQDEPSVYQYALARSLGNLAKRLSQGHDMGCRAEAIDCAREAVQIRRSLADNQPAAYLAELVGALISLSDVLSNTEDAEFHVEAIARAREAIDLYRRLAEAEPSIFLPRMAATTQRIADQWSKHKNVVLQQEAFGYAREAVQMYRQLAEDEPTVYLAYLAVALNNLGIRLHKQGNASTLGEALQFAREGTQIRRHLAENRSTTQLSNLAKSLNRLAKLLADDDDPSSRSESLSCAQEAVTLYVRLHSSMPERFEQDLHTAEKTLARAASLNGRNPEEDMRAVAGNALDAPQQTAS